MRTSVIPVLRLNDEVVERIVIALRSGPAPFVKMSTVPSAKISPPEGTPHSHSLPNLDALSAWGLMREMNGDEPGVESVM